MAFNKTKLVSDENKGFIYILANPYIPNLVKIGKTTVDPGERAKQISNWEGVPGEFKVIYKEIVFNCHIIEQEVHQKIKIMLSSDGYGHKTKEFFVVPSTEYAISAVRTIIKKCCKIYKQSIQKDLFGGETTLWYSSDDTWIVKWHKRHKKRFRSNRKISPIEARKKLEWWSQNK